MRSAINAVRRRRAAIAGGEFGLSGKHAYFSVSKSIDPMSGDGTCAPSPTDCTLLVLGVGQAENMTYTVDGKTYRVKINKINLVRKRAPTG